MKHSSPGAPWTTRSIFEALTHGSEALAISLDALAANFEALTSRGRNLGHLPDLRSTRAGFGSIRDEFGRTWRQFRSTHLQGHPGPPIRSSEAPARDLEALSMNLEALATNFEALTSRGGKPGPPVRSSEALAHGLEALTINLDALTIDVEALARSLKALTRAQPRCPPSPHQKRAATNGSSHQVFTFPPLPPVPLPAPVPNLR